MALQRVAVVRGAAHRRRLGRAARGPSGECAARGNVWRHRRALEGLALRLPPDAMAQPVTAKEGWGAVAAAGSEGREGAAGPGAPFLGRLSAVHAVHLGRLGSGPQWQKCVG